MRLLITRPEPFASETAAALTARGHTVLVQPLLVTTFAPAPRGLAQPAALIFTSRNGVAAVTRWPAARHWLNRPAFASGPGTARALTAAGFADVHVGAGDGAALAAAVGAVLPPGAGPLLYVAARDRSLDLGADLVRAGYRTTTVEAYRTDAVPHLMPATVAALKGGAIDAVLIYSRRTAAALADAAAVDGVRDALARVEGLAISDAVAAVLAPHVRAVRVATRPDEDAMLALVTGGK